MTTDTQTCCECQETVVSSDDDQCLACGQLMCDSCKLQHEDECE